MRHLLQVFGRRPRPRNYEISIVIPKHWIYPPTRVVPDKVLEFFWSRQAACLRPLHDRRGDGGSTGIMGPSAGPRV